MKTPDFTSFLSLLLLFLPTFTYARTVDVVTPEIRDVEITTSQPAFVEAYHVADIGSRVSGIVNIVHVDIGQKVTQGKILAVVSAPELDRRQEAMAAESAVAQTNLEAEKANLEATRAETQRIIDLVANNSVTAKAGEEAKKKLATANARHKAAEAELKAAIARLAEAEAMVGFASLRAPFDGVVTHRDLDPGDLVVGDQSQPLFQVSQVNKLRVVIHVPEKDSQFADAGDAVTFSFDALPGRVLDGKVTRMAHSLSPKTQRMRVEVDIVPEGYRLLPGAYGRATIQLLKKEDVLTVPAEVVRLDSGKPIVYVVSEGKIQHQPVTLGVDHGVWVEITSGLKGTEQIVKGSIDNLPEGTAVQIR